MIGNVLYMTKQTHLAFFILFLDHSHQYSGVNPDSALINYCWQARVSYRMLEAFKPRFSVCKANVPPLYYCSGPIFGHLSKNKNKTKQNLLYELGLSEKVSGLINFLPIQRLHLQDIFLATVNRIGTIMLLNFAYFVL